MKKTLSILVFTLLLAVGWTNSASAQKLDLGKPWYASAFFTKMHQPTMDNGKTAQTVEVNFDNQEILFDSPNGAKVNRSKAPKRANYTVTANATHVKSWYDAKHYTWYDADNNEQTAPTPILSPMLIRCSGSPGLFIATRRCPVSSFPQLRTLTAIPLVLT